MNKESDEPNTKGDLGGFLHWLEPRPKRFRKSSRPSIDLSGIEASPELASIDIRHKVYSRLIENSSSAYVTLAERKLPHAKFGQLGYRRLEQKERWKIVNALWAEFGRTLLTVPGFVIGKKDQSRYVTISGKDGLLIPVRNADGQIAAIKHRADKKPENAKLSRYTWLSSSSKYHDGPSSGSHVHIPLGTPRDADQLRITEGEMKADASFEISKIPTISIPGASTWRKAIDVVEILQPKSILVALDADCWTKKEVADALFEMTNTLLAKGYSVILETWNLDDAKGIDDLLLKGLSPIRFSGEELIPKILEIRESARAAKSPGAESAGSNSNDPAPDDWVCNGVPSGEDEIIPLLLPSILARIQRAAGSWPRKVDDKLFVHNEGTDDPVEWMPKPDNLISHLGMITKNKPPKFYTQPGFHTKSDVFIAVKRTAQSYEAMEIAPHEPLVANHYYACEPIEPTPDIPADSFNPSEIEKLKKTKLDQFLDFFDFFDDVDRSLALAMFATIIWGGPGGARPLFVVTCKKGRGAGKSTMVEIFSEFVGGCMEFGPNDNPEEVKKRLLSPAGRIMRICRLDNLKTHRFSNAELEGMITSPWISGKEMFVGEGSRPNLVTWVATVNGFNASTDIAQRSVIIFIKKPTHSADWSKRTKEFAAAHRKEIIGDLIAFLRREPAPMGKTSRWGEWERCVLSHLPDYEAAQKAMLDRQCESDIESSEDDILGDFLFDITRELGYGKHDRIFIPNIRMAKWSSDAMQEKANTSRVNSALKQRIEEDKFNYLKISPSRTYGRGYLYFKGHEKNGEFGGLNDYDEEKGDKTHYDVEERILKNKINIDAEIRAEVIRKSSDGHYRS